MACHFVYFMITVLLMVGEGFSYAGDTNAALFNAINTGSLSQVRSVFTNNRATNVDATDAGYGNATPLIVAAKANAVDIVKLLLDKGADTSRKDDNGYSALHYAAMLGFADVVQALLKSGADPNIQHAINSQTALIACLTPSSPVSLCNGKIVVTLLNNSASPNIAGQNGQTALDLAKTTTSEALYLSFLGGCIVARNGACVTALVDGQQIARRGFDTLSQPVVGFPRADATVLSIAVQSGQRLIADRLLAAGSNPDKPPYVISVAVKTGDIEMVRVLTNYGVNVNAPSPSDCNSTALMTCALADGVDNLCTLDIFNYLLRKKASTDNVNCQRQDVFQIAAANKVNKGFFAALNPTGRDQQAIVSNRGGEKPVPNIGSVTSRIFPCGYEKGVLATTTTTTTQQPTTREAGKRGARPTHSSGLTTHGTEAWYPWMARLRIDYEGSKPSYCGASIITANWLLTAAHCLQQEGSKLLRVEIQMGNHNWTQIEPGQKEPQPARDIVIHPFYKSEPVYENDFALLRLNVPIALFDNKIQPICLPDHPLKMCEANVALKNTSLSQVDSCHAVISAGWGLNENSVLTSTLQKVNLEVAPYTSCAENLNITLKDTMICAGSQNGQDTCQGDSGGPLMCKVGDRYVVMGVVSFGGECGKIGVPSVYSRVCKAIDWIKTVTNFDFANGNANDNGRLSNRN